MVQPADAMEAGRSDQVAEGASSTKMIEQATLGRRQDEGEIVEEQGHYDRHAGDQPPTPRPPIEPRLKKLTQFAKACRVRHGRSQAPGSERRPERVNHLD